MTQQERIEKMRAMLYASRKRQPTIIEMAIQTYGAENQVNIAIEEMSELTKELCKAKRGYANKRNIAEEMADVLIMLEQIKLIFGIKQRDIDEWAKVKLQRLENNIERDG